MNDIQNILFPTDFSNNAQNALPYAVDLVKKKQGKLSLLNVYDIPLMAPADAFGMSEDTMANVSQDMRATAQDKLKQIIEDNNLTDLRHRCFVREGVVEDEILQVIQKNDIHLVVMGTKGEASEQGLFMGSITKGVMQHAGCPVLAIPESAEYRQISTIVFATDLQHDESHMVNYMVGFARHYDAEIIVLHIDHDNNYKEWSIELLKNIIDKTDYPKITFKELVNKDTGEGINDYIAAQNPDLLSITTYTTTLFDKIFHKSLTKQMLLQSKIPLLIFNRKKYDTVFLG